MKTRFTLAIFAMLLTACAGTYPLNSEPSEVEVTRVVEVTAAPASSVDSQNMAGIAEAPPAAPASAPAEANTLSCPTREEADDLVFGKNADGSHKDIFVQVGSEACAFQVNTANPAYTYDGDIPKGVIATAHRPDRDQAEVFEGPVKLSFWRITVRWPTGYPASDDIQKGPCEILRKEIANGQAQTWQFGVVAGNINCPDLPGPNVEGNLVENRSALLTNCPKFGDKATNPENDGAPYCKYKGAVVTDAVPAGFKVEYWDGHATLYAGPGDMITTGEATFRPVQ